MKLKKRRSSEVSLGRRRDVSDVLVELPRADDGESGKNEYYLSVAKKYRLARLVTLAAFILFALFMMTAFSSEITIDNMMYLLRDINVNSGGAAFSGVSYSAEPIQRFGLYKGELLYVTGSEEKLFSPTGAVGLSVGMSFESPLLDVSEKYILTCGLDGYGFSVCNSFSELFRGTAEYPILSCDMADSGDFVIVTGGREHRSTVYLYGGDFELRTKYSKGDFVSDAAISNDGKRLAVTSFGVLEGEYYTDVTFYDVGADAPSGSDRIGGEYPLAVETMGDGFSVLTTASVRIYRRDGTLSGSYIHGGVGMYNVSDAYVLLTAPKNATGTENSVVILDSAASVCYNAVIGEKVVDAAVSDTGEAFLLSQGHAVMINPADGTERTAVVGVGAKRIIPTGDGTALLCLSSSAYTIDFAHPSHTEAGGASEDETGQGG